MEYEVAAVQAKAMLYLEEQLVYNDPIPKKLLSGANILFLDLFMSCLC